MTKEELKEVKRVCGENFHYTDIPAYIRERDEKKEIEKAMADDALVEELREKEYGKE